MLKDTNHQAPEHILLRPTHNLLLPRVGRFLKDSIHIGTSYMYEYLLQSLCIQPASGTYLIIELTIRESVGSLCRDGADAQYMQYITCT